MGPAKDLAKPLLDVDELLAANAARVEKILTSLKNGTGDDAPSLPVGEGTPYDDIWALRFCLSHDEDDEATTDNNEEFTLQLFSIQNELIFKGYQTPNRRCEKPVFLQKRKVRF